MYYRCLKRERYYSLTKNILDTQQILDEETLLISNIKQDGHEGERIIFEA